MADATPFVYQNSFGYRLTFNTGQSLEGVTNFQLKIKGSTTTVSRDLTDANILDVEAGTVFYDVEDGDFDEVTTYLLQLIDSTPGRFLPSQQKKLKVKETL